MEHLVKDPITQTNITYADAQKELARIEQQIAAAQAKGDEHTAECWIGVYQQRVAFYNRLFAN